MIPFFLMKRISIELFMNRQKAAAKVGISVIFHIYISLDEKKLKHRCDLCLSVCSWRQREFIAPDNLIYQASIYEHTCPSTFCYFDENVDVRSRVQHNNSLSVHIISTLYLHLHGNIQTSHTQLFSNLTFSLLPGLKWFYRITLRFRWNK